MLSRKQFLNEILIRGVRALASFGDTSGEIGPSRDSDLLTLNELNPSLLKMEAERLGIDLTHVDEVDLRNKIYAALCQKCRRQSDSST